MVDEIGRACRVHIREEERDVYRMLMGNPGRKKAL
jgi:hypothetical protein